MIKISDKSNCCGCGACMNACTQSSITMMPDQEGFLYPRINEDSCIDCGMCESVCPILTAQHPNGRSKAFAAYSLNEDIIRSSSSGGAFHAFANYILKEGGVIFGAAFNKDYTLHTVKAENAKELLPLQGAKYVQCDTKSTFKEIEQNLLEGKKVLYCSTGCQVQGLKSYLGKDYDNLYTIDFICHGVVSPAIWDYYRNTIETKHGKKITKVNFRDKREGWECNNIRLKFEDESEFVERNNTNAYMKAFVSGLSMRPSCYTCKFKGEHRNCDLTIADLWGAKYQCPEGHHEMGTSLILAHTQHGLDLLEKCKDKLHIVPAPMPASVAFNESLTKPTPQPLMRDVFFSRYKTEDFSTLVNRCMPLPPKAPKSTLMFRIIGKAKSLIKKCIQKA